MTNLIFDYDGTLHDCIKIYAPAFRLAYAYLVSRRYAPKREWTEKEISRWLGFSAADMWNSFAPGLLPDEKKLCSQMIGEEMLRLTENGEAQLYPGALSALGTLKNQGFRLIFLSNCKRAYMEAHKKRFGLEAYFDGFFCAEDYGWRPKTEIFPAVREAFGGEFLVIGDRFHDMEMAQRHRLRAIGCTYGYGTREELLNAWALAGDVRELLELILSLKRNDAIENISQ